MGIELAMKRPDGAVMNYHRIDTVRITRAIDPPHRAAGFMALAYINITSFSDREAAKRWDQRDDLVPTEVIQRVCPLASFEAVSIASLYEWLCAPLQLGEDGKPINETGFNDGVAVVEERGES
ncbi:hypothetical protein ACG04Q_11775 [Roseateles sp. DXS20W]|uniref:Uncharacterized protein n=1 Tax=Pelomonas lactea TaxID=3299030 RepID=A0ABW7GK78_9BURK